MNIALMVGGFSSEREVSLASGKGVLKALRQNGHSVVVVDPVYGNKSVPEDIIFRDEVKSSYPKVEDLKQLWSSSYRNTLDCINSKLFDNIDIVFIALHGKYSEDGRLQSILEARNLKFTGSDMFASVKAIDKDLSKTIFAYNNVPTAPWVSFTRKQKNLKDTIDSRIGFPCVIKPNDEGSTVGLSIVYNPDLLEAAITAAFGYSEKIVVEKYIKGREITVPILGEEALPVIEVKPKDGFYDYQHKYTKGMTEYVCPAELPIDIARKAQEVALTAHNVLGCSVYSRVDFLMDINYNFYCLEVNTLPGMTELSLVPKAAKVVGIEFNELVERIINLSLDKYAY
ncbi:MAG: D-alanine--D-alanine ligase [Ignavibacteria bacterium]